MPKEKGIRDEQGKLLICLRACGSLQRLCAAPVVLAILTVATAAAELGDGSAASWSVKQEPAQLVGRQQRSERIGRASAVKRGPHAPLDRSHSAEQQRGLTRWTSYPIFRGEMTSIAVDPQDHQRVYVGTRDAGVFKSLNGGASWFPARAGLSFYPIRSLAVDPLDSGTVYAGTDYDGVWRTTDSGASWLRVSTGIDDSLVVTSLIVHPSQPGRVLAGMAGGLGLPIGQIYLSTTSGASWSRHDAGIPRESGHLINGVRCLAMDPEDADRLAASTTYAGVFYSENGGASWQARLDGLPGDSGYLDVVGALAFNHHDTSHPDGSRLCAVISGLDGGFACLGDTDAWTVLSGFAEITSADHLQLHPSDSSIIIASGGLSGACMISHDSGASWTRSLAHPQSGRVSEVAFHPSLPTTLFAAADITLSTELGGVYVSTDLGASWHLASNGITAAAIRSVAVAPNDPSIILAGTGTGGLLRSVDGGQTWSRAREQGEPDDYTFGFHTDGIVVDPLDPMRVYIASSELYTSADGGESFAMVPQVGNAECLAVTSTAPTTFWVGTSFGGGVFKGGPGQTWAQVNNGLPMFGDELCPIISIEVDPNDPETVWAGTQFGGGVVKTETSGASWQVMGLAHENLVEAIAVSPANSDTVLASAGFSSGTIYRSTDGGLSWSPVLSGIGLVYDLAFNPSEPEIVYAASGGSGVLRSADAGASWQELSNGLFYPVIYSLALSGRSPTVLHAASFGSGLYRRIDLGGAGLFGDDLESGDLSRWSSARR